MSTPLGTFNFLCHIGWRYFCKHNRLVLFSCEVILGPKLNCTVTLSLHRFKRMPCEFCLQQLLGKYLVLQLLICQLLPLYTRNIRAYNSCLHLHETGLM